MQNQLHCNVTVRFKSISPRKWTDKFLSGGRIHSASRCSGYVLEVSSRWWVCDSEGALYQTSAKLTGHTRVAGLQMDCELRRARSEGVHFRVGHADVTGRPAGADSVDIAEYVGRAAETRRVQLLQRRQVGIGRDTAPDTHPTEQRRLHDDDVTVLASRAKRLQVTELLTCPRHGINDNSF